MNADFRIPYSVKETLTRCQWLQKCARMTPNCGAAELMRLATSQRCDEELVVALCRILYNSKTESPIRWPGKGAPLCLGGTSQEDWPEGPVYFYQGVPFYIVKGWSIAGFVEPATWYLAECIQSGEWNSTAHPIPDDDELKLIAESFIQNGPWKVPLCETEQDFFISQATPSGTRSETGTLTSEETMTACCRLLESHEGVTVEMAQHHPRGSATLILRITNPTSVALLAHHASDACMGLSVWPVSHVLPNYQSSEPLTRPNPICYRLHSTGSVDSPAMAQVVTFCVCMVADLVNQERLDEAAGKQLRTQWGY